MKKIFAQEPIGTLESITGYAPDTGADAGTTSLTRILSNTIGVLTIVAGLMFILFFIFGGLNWLSAGGKPEKVEKAKSMMTNAAIGLIVVVAAYAVAYIIGEVLGFTILDPGHYILNLWGNGSS